MSEVSVRRSGPIAELILDRPEKRNAISLPMWAQIEAACAALAREPGVRALLIRGAREVFSAGADIDELGTAYRTPQEAAENIAVLAGAMDAVENFPAPVLAMIEGPCVGGGCALALCADIRFAAEGAKLGITPARLGLSYPLADVRRLQAAVGHAVAADMLFSGRLLEAHEAQRCGLLNRVCAPEALETETRAYLDDLAQRAPTSQRAIKAALKRVREGAQQDDPDTFARLVAAYHSAAFKEGRAAFLEKRAPVFPDA